jgi:hypothetical protein
MAHKGLIERIFTHYQVIYTSQPFTANPPTNSRRVYAVIDCINVRDRETVGYINFYDLELLPPNSYDWLPPNSKVLLGFHISRFKDIMTILHYETQLVISIDTDTLEGSVISSVGQPIGRH